MGPFHLKANGNGGRNKVGHWGDKFGAKKERTLQANRPTTAVFASSKMQISGTGMELP